MKITNVISVIALTVLGSVAYSGTSGWIPLIATVALTMLGLGLAFTVAALGYALDDYEIELEEAELEIEGLRLLNLERAGEAFAEVAA